MMNKYLKTDRILLREMTLDDGQNIFELDSDPEVMKHLTNDVPSSREDPDNVKRIKLGCRLKKKIKISWGA